jgi:hypothetical protein
MDAEKVISPRERRAELQSQAEANEAANDAAFEQQQADAAENQRLINEAKANQAEDANQTEG